MSERIELINIYLKDPETIEARLKPGNISELTASQLTDLGSAVVAVADEVLKYIDSHIDKSGVIDE